MKRTQQQDHHFFKIPNRIFDVGLDPFAFMIYCYLVRRAGNAGECWPSYERMHVDLGISTSTIQDRIAYLKKRKLITISKHNNAGEFKNNVYHIRSLNDPDIYRTIEEYEELPLYVGEELLL